jgi:hypothetical protein
MRRWNLAVAILLAGAGFLGAFTAGLLHLERQEGFCVACHLHQAKDGDMRAPPKAVGQLAALHFAKGTGCADCHREPGPFGRAITLYTLGVRDVMSFLLDDYAEPERLTHPLKNALCIECHADTLAGRNNMDTYHGNEHHNARQDIFCTTCHLHHIRGDPGYAYLELSAFESGCVSCHEGLYDVRPAQRLKPATGALSQTRAILRERGIQVR